MPAISSRKASHSGSRSTTASPKRSSARIRRRWIRPVDNVKFPPFAMYRHRQITLTEQRLFQMKHVALAVMVALGALALARQADAAACANGVYRAGCVGPNGAAVVRKTPPPNRHVTSPNAAY